MTFFEKFGRHGREEPDKKDRNCYLTVYMSLTMAALLSLCLTLIEGVRMGTVRMETECIMDIGMNSILAEYHRGLLERYNLFFTDVSYGSAIPSCGRTASRLKNYLEANAAADRGALEDFWYRDLLEMRIGAVEITEVSLASDNRGAVFRQRAQEAVRDDIGLTFLGELAGWMNTVETNGFFEWDGAEEKESIDSQIKKYDGSEKQISEKEWITVRIDNPTAWLDEKRSAGVLNLVLQDTDSLSRMAIDTTGLISERMKRGEVNEGTVETKGDGTALIDRLVFQEYLLRYMGHYGQEPDRDALRYQAEYLVAGKGSDVENLKGTVYRISALREAANALYLFSDKEKCAEADALAALLAAAMLVPEIQPLLKTSFLLAWAYAESLYDVKCLLSGGRVPLLKDDESWHYGIGCIFDGNNTEKPGAQGGQDYKDYLRILMAFTDLDTLTLRAMDMIEADIRQTPGNAAFRMDACADWFEASAEVQSGFGGTFSIVRNKGYRTCLWPAE